MTDTYKLVQTPGLESDTGTELTHYRLEWAFAKDAAEELHAKHGLDPVVEMLKLIISERQSM